MFKIIAATKNKNKVSEFKELLKNQKVEIKSLLDYPKCPEIVESGSTFEENAEIKALAASDYSGLAAFADDSGLEVDALDNRPGIHSARYAGENAQDIDRIQKLLEELQGQPNRKARFVCVLAIAYNGEVLKTFRGEVLGQIIDTPRGQNGFGYDPIFVPDGQSKTFAEMSDEEKNKISHRAVAVQAALDFIEEDMATIDGFED